jgi:ribonuclease HIII
MTEQSNVVSRSEYNDIKMKYMGLAQVLVAKHNQLVGALAMLGEEIDDEAIDQMTMVADDFNATSEVFEMVQNGGGTFAIFTKDQDESSDG